MSQPKWSYSPWRDDMFWKLLVAAAAGAVPGAGLSPVSWRVAMQIHEREGNAVVTALFLAPAFLLLAWGVAICAVAARRVVRLRRLARCGVEVPAVVRHIRLLRSKSAAVGAVVKLEYEVEGSTYRTKIRTSARSFPWGTRENGHLDVVVDPDAPAVSALVLDGRLF